MKAPLWLVMLAVSATAGAASERFAVAVGGEAVAEEEFTFAQTDTGQSLTGTVQLRQQGGLVHMTYEQGFAADWTPRQYRLSQQRGNDERLVEAWVDGGQVRMRLADSTIRPA